MEAYIFNSNTLKLMLLRAKHGYTTWASFETAQQFFKIFAVIYLCSEEVCIDCLCRHRSEGRL